MVQGPGVPWTTPGSETPLDRTAPEKPRPPKNCRQSGCRRRVRRVRRVGSVQNVIYYNFVIFVKNVCIVIGFMYDTHMTHLFDNCRRRRRTRTCAMCHVDGGGVQSDSNMKSIEKSDVATDSKTQPKTPAKRRATPAKKPAKSESVKRVESFMKQHGITENGVYNVRHLTSFVFGDSDNHDVNERNGKIVRKHLRSINGGAQSVRRAYTFTGKSVAAYAIAIASRVGDVKPVDVTDNEIDRLIG